MKPVITLPVPLVVTPVTTNVFVDIVLPLIVIFVPAINLSCLLEIIFIPSIIVSYSKSDGKVNPLSKPTFSLIEFNELAIELAS